MKLDKRACRHAANVPLHISLNAGVLYTERVKYLVTAAVKLLGGHRVLAVYFYECERLKANDRMHWHDYRRTGRVKGTEQILATAAHGALAVATLDVDCIAPIAACGAQELAEMRIGGSKTGNGQKITPISNCAQRNNLAQFL